MKLSLVYVLALAAPVAAFVAPVAPHGQTFLRSTEEAIDTPVIDAAPVEPPAPKLPEKSQAMPFMARPAALTGEMAGDVGFDPLGFAKDTSTLLSMREAEIKHARLAMLAAAGWPISELMDKGLAKVFGLSPLLDSADRVPSLLNGGLGKVSPFYWGAVIGLSAAIDLYGMSRKNTPDYTPGDLGFDPLGLYPKTPEDRKNMQLAEVKNG